MKSFLAQITNPAINPAFGTGGEGGDILARMMASFLQVVFIVAGLILLATLIWAGYDWMTAGGDKAKYESAHKRLTMALIGFLIFMSVFAIINFIAPILGLEFLDILNITWPTPGGAGG